MGIGVKSIERNMVWLSLAFTVVVEVNIADIVFIVGGKQEVRCGRSVAVFFVGVHQMFAKHLNNNYNAIINSLKLF